MILETAMANSNKLLDDGLKKMLTYVKPFTRRFIFNADASHKQGRLGHHEIDIVCRNARYAVKPFPNTYIEIDNHAMVRGRGDPVDPDSCERIGFWWTQFGHCFVIDGDERNATFTPFIYAEHGAHSQGVADADRLFDLYKKDPNASEETHSHISYDQIKTLLMCGGGSAMHMGDATRQFTDLYEIGMTKDGLPHKVLDYFLQENIGTFKYGIAALMMLDERVQRKLVPVAATRKIIKGKLKAVPAHHMVTIDLDVPSIRNVYANPIGHRDSPLEHDVSEHWVVYDASSQCTHNWQPFWSEDAAKRDMKAGHEKPLRREYCTLCGGRRTRKPNYVSGDPKKGSTVGTKSYRVVASKEKERTGWK